MEIRNFDENDLRDFNVDESTAQELNIQPGVYGGHSCIFGAGMYIYLMRRHEGKYEGADYQIFINFDDITRNKNAQNLVNQVLG